MAGRGKVVVDGESAEANQLGKRAPDDPALGPGYKAAGRGWVTA